MKTEDNLNNNLLDKANSQDIVNKTESNASKVPQSQLFVNINKSQRYTIKKKQDFPPIQQNPIIEQVIPKWFIISFILLILVLLGLFAVFIFQNIVKQDLKDKNSSLTFTLSFIKNNANFSSIQTLNFVGTPIKDSGFQIISQLPFGNLNSIVLNNQQITDKGISYLDNLNNNQFSTLNLQNNKITDAGVPYLWKYNNTIQEMNLAQNFIIEGIQNFQSSNTLQILNLNSNAITAVGILYLLNFNYPSLTTLDLGSRAVNQNEIGDLGISTLITLASNRNLVYLNLSLNNIGNNGINSFTNIGSLNYTIQTLDISNNKISIFPPTLNSAVFPQLTTLIIKNNPYSIQELNNLKSYFSTTSVTIIQ